MWLIPLADDAPWLVSEAERAWSEPLPAMVRRRYLCSRSLLRRRLVRLLNLPPDAVPLHSQPGAPPRLAEGYGYVSLSHSRDQLLLAWSPWPIGVDLEWQEREIQAELLARRFFPPQEWQQLQAHAPRRLAEMVLESWVRKEAAIKWRQSSLASDLRHWYWNVDTQQLLHLEQGWQPPSVCERRHGWICAVVGQEAEAGNWS